MLFLMILGVFSGAVAVTWRNLHIRIDTLVERLPPPIRRATMLVASLASIAILARGDGRELSAGVAAAIHGSAQRCAECAELAAAVLRDDRARPDGIDDAGPDRGLAPSLDRRMTPRVRHDRPAHCRSAGAASAHGSSDLRGLAGGRPGRDRAQRQPHSCVAFRHLRQSRHLPAARRPAVHLCRRYHVARRHCAAADRAHSVAGRRGARRARDRHRCRLRSVQRDVRLERGLRRRHRQAHHPGAEEERLRRYVLGQPGHGDRRDRRHHAALDHDDHLRDSGAAIGAAAVSRRFPGRHSHRHRARDLRGLVCAGQENPHHRAGAAQGHPRPSQGLDLGAAGAHRHSRRHLWRPVHADRGRRRRLHLRHRDLDVRLSRADLGGAVGHHHRVRPR